MRPVLGNVPTEEDNGATGDEGILSSKTAKRRKRIAMLMSPMLCAMSKER